MQAGQNPYPHMRTIIFSSSLKLPDATDVDLQASCETASIDAIRRHSTGAIYLCGGGVFTGSLLAMGQIDVLRLNRAPIILGDGVPLFGDTETSPDLEHVETRRCDDRYLFQENRILQA